jgi:hemoglobin
MSKDIDSRDDLFVIVRDFYELLFQSIELKSFFEDFKDPEVLENHLETLVDFWDNTLFYSGSYKKNAMKPHMELHQKTPLNSVHFEHWLHLLTQAIDKNFKGANAETMKNRARSIATVMKIKFAIE